MNGMEVSVIIPTKNRRLLLEAAVQSVRAQTVGNWELIVVDDYSLDHTCEFVRHIGSADARVRLLRSKRGCSAGAPACRNVGFGEASGEYVLFLDSDDGLSRTCLEERLAAMISRPELDFGVFPCHLFREIPENASLLWNLDTGNDDIDRFLELDVPWNTSSVLWRRSALLRLGPWDENLKSWQDWEFHLRALVCGLTYERFPLGTSYWRMPHGHTVGKQSASPGHLRSHERLLRGVHGMLDARDLLNPARRLRVAGLYFWMAKKWIANKRLDDALRVWSQCRETNLIDLKVYREGQMHLISRHYAVLRNATGSYLELRWPELLMLRPSPTFRRVRIGEAPGGPHAPASSKRSLSRDSPVHLLDEVRLAKAGL